ncbi:MAG: FAD-linked oxidase C-terminal domain-containing protein [Ilumatobacter sp.]|uniref:FAD-linked oxidase C-terminal domain-containing protein n=1 Tax=Ilumatobacter sp. TaxID=1967498 RepID=UPI00261FEEF6|nr:FAD-linked oxidase C-terminal domain-containing protein [Ilumatobacter sp.]MDJ0767373.1 FAD-linked oxidase C-terminal domain-containing protein [Ilumatobacter sp.]
MFDRIKQIVRREEPDSDQCFADLCAALSPDRVKRDGAHRALLAHDASLFGGGVAGPLCYPENAFEVAAVMRIAIEHGRGVVPRGAGTGLAGGAIPLGAPIVVALTRMNRVLDVDVDDRVAWVEPGVINLDLDKHLGPLGYHFAPDPSSQQVCTIGGNVANNSGGPHCLQYGVTNAHILALEVVLPSGDIAMFGGLDAEPAGLDLRGAFVGSEGTLGIVTRVAVRLTKNAPSVRTLLLSFGSVHDAANTVSAVIAAGVVPAAMEVMDQKITVAVENYVGAGYPVDAAAVLLAEVEGLPGGTEVDAATIERLGREHGATDVRLAATDEERALLWKGRKTAFGAIAQIAPDYYLHDTVVPRSKLAEVLEQVYEIADRHDVIVMNVFHAGDGNLHPLLLFDAREPGVIDRVHAAGEEILRASLDAGGVLSGEHGIGVEKQKFMAEQFSDDDLDHQARLRRAFDPDCRANPGKVLPASHSCADIQALRSVPTGVWG